MSETVILAEKPSQAKAYAEAFNVQRKTKHAIFLQPDAIFPNGAVITWGIGHLVELKQPGDYDESWKKWHLKQLPIFPKAYEYKVANGKWEQFQEIKKLFKEAKTLINACDVDREGSNIFYSILRQTKIKNKEIKRLWINSLEVDEIRKGFQQLQNNEKDLRMFYEAETRQISDWLVGMNASRLMTLLLKQRGLNEVISIGRVQSPTVYMIYERTVEIEQFKPEKFYEVIGQFEGAKGSYKGKFDKKFETAEEAQQLLQQASITLNERVDGTVANVAVKRKRILPPKLHSLSTLQQKANRLWKYPPAQVLQTAQNLYEKKLISYPRSDCQFITPAEFQYVKNNLQAYQALMKKPFEPKMLTPSKRYVDAKKVEEHYAIIPTKKVPTVAQLAKLSLIEKNLYAEIMRTTLAMFHYDYEYDETTIFTDVANVRFKTVGKVEVQKGFEELWPAMKAKKEAVSMLPVVQQGERVDAFINIHEGQTQPPKPYTEGQLIQMMKTCGKLIEDEVESEILKEVEGIGTEATRAGIIETIKKHNYIEVTKNIVAITEKGKVLCECIKDSLLASPMMTAKWENYLRKIGEGTGTKEAFLQNIEKFIAHLIEQGPQNVARANITNAIEQAPEKSSKEPITQCPLCHKGHIIDKYKVYGCSDYAAGCKFVLPKKVASKALTRAQVKQLCDYGKTKPLKGFKSKKGATFSAALILQNDGKVAFDFAQK